MMSFNKGDIVLGKGTLETAIVVSTICGSNNITVYYLRQKKNTSLMNQSLFTLVSTGRPGQHVRFIYEKNILDGVIYNTLDDGSYVIDSAHQGMVIGVSPNDVWAPNDTNEELKGNERLNHKQHVDAHVEASSAYEGTMITRVDEPPKLPDNAPCFKCTEFEQASGWAYSPVTYECKTCRKVKI